jgi:hypothetical protein
VFNKVMREGDIIIKAELERILRLMS